MGINLKGLNTAHGTASLGKSTVDCLVAIVDPAQPKSRLDQEARDTLRNLTLKRALVSAGVHLARYYPRSLRYGTGVPDLCRSNRDAFRIVGILR